MNNYYADTEFYIAEDIEELLDECVSCGGEARLYCSDCKSSRCSPCNDLWHKHRKRRGHNIEVNFLTDTCCHLFACLPINGKTIITNKSLQRIYEFSALFSIPLTKCVGLLVEIPD